MNVVISSVALPITPSIFEKSIAVGVICCSFILIWKMIHIGADKFEKIAEHSKEALKEIADKNAVDRTEHKELVQSLTDSHKEERSEWKTDVTVVVGEMVDLIKKMDNG